MPEVQGSPDPPWGGPRDILIHLSPQTAAQGIRHVILSQSALLADVADAQPWCAASLGSARVRLPSLLVRLCRSFEMSGSPPCSLSFALFGEPSAVQAAQ